MSTVTDHLCIEYIYICVINRWFRLRSFFYSSSLPWVVLAVVIALLLILSFFIRWRRVCGAFFKRKSQDYNQSGDTEEGNVVWNIRNKLSFSVITNWYYNRRKLRHYNSIAANTTHGQASLRHQRSSKLWWASYRKNISWTFSIDYLFGDMMFVMIENHYAEPLNIYCYHCIISHVTKFKRALDIRRRFVQPVTATVKT